MIRAVVFDLDGVLTDSAHMWIDLYRNIYYRLGFTGEISDEKITTNFGSTYEKTLEGFLPVGVIDESYKMLMDELNSDRWISKMEPLPQVIPTLHKLMAAGIRMGVASGNDRSILARSLKQLGISDMFPIAVSTDDVKNPKPAADSILLALAHLKVEPESAAYVGDSPNDVLAAKAAGVVSVACLTGVMDGKRAEALKPDFIINDLSELPAVIGIQ